MDEYMGIIKPFCGNYAPRDWMFCDGTALNIREYSALYTILGLTYGGDGINTFCLPDLRGRVAIENDNSSFNLGESAGTENETITSSTFPSHSHAFNGLDGVRETNDPEGNYLGIAAGNFYCQQQPGDNLLPMNPLTVSVAPGNSGSHNNMAPYVAINYIICVYGVYPPRP